MALRFQPPPSPTPPCRTPCGIRLFPLVSQICRLGTLTGATLHRGPWREEKSCSSTTTGITTRGIPLAFAPASRLRATPSRHLSFAPRVTLTHSRYGRLLNTNRCFRIQLTVFWWCDSRGLTAPFRYDTLRVFPDEIWYKASDRVRAKETASTMSIYQHVSRCCARSRSRISCTPLSRFLDRNTQEADVRQVFPNRARLMCVCLCPTTVLCSCTAVLKFVGMTNATASQVETTPIQLAEFMETIGPCLG